MAAFLQRHSLHLHQMQSPFRFQGKIQSAFAECHLRMHCQHAPLARRPLPEHPVGRLRIHVNQLSGLLHRHQIPRRLAVWIVAAFQPYLSPRHQQFPAAPCVFHMANHLSFVQQNSRDKAVRPVQKNGFFYTFVSH